MQELLGELRPVLFEAVATVLIVVIPLIAKVVIKFFKAKIVEVENRIGNQNYDAIAKVAEDIYFAVEQNFLNGFIEDKRAEFDKKLLERCPDLKQEEIDRVRETIVGKINSYLK